MVIGRLCNQSHLHLHRAAAAGRKSVNHCNECPRKRIHFRVRCSSHSPSSSRKSVRLPFHFIRFASQFKDVDERERENMYIFHTRESLPSSSAQFSSSRRSRCTLSISGPPPSQRNASFLPSLSSCGLKRQKRMRPLPHRLLRGRGMDYPHLEPLSIATFGINTIPQLFLQMRKDGRLRLPL